MATESGSDGGDLRTVCERKERRSEASVSRMLVMIFDREFHHR